jgi:pilus assembly protein Flp/PilA
MFTFLTFVQTWLAARLPKGEKGQDLAEYGLLVALIAIVVLVAVTVFGSNLSAFFARIAATVATW